MLTATAAVLATLTADNAKLRAELALRKRADAVIDAQVVLDADRARRLLESQAGTQVKRVWSSL